MPPAPSPLHLHFGAYADRLSEALASFDWAPVEQLALELKDCWASGRQVFIIGNGGSAANAVHLANDLVYPVSKRPGSGLRVHALPSNPAVLTCLANDEGYDQIFSAQLSVLARPGDVLIAFSTSGESPNIINALKEAPGLGLRSFAVVGYDGGAARPLADVPIHCPTEDTQIAEDLQLVIGHMVVQWLYAQRNEIDAEQA